MQPSLLICFTGIDGSGKTTQAELLVNWLNSKGIKSSYVWSRGEVLTIRRILLLLGRRAMGVSGQDIVNNKESYREYQSRKSKFLQNSFVRMLWSTMTYIEHLIQINGDIRKRIQAGYVVVCDRYLWDSTIDMAILNNKNPEWLTNRMNLFMWKLVPQPSVTFFINIPPEEAFRRKNDIPSIDYVSKRAVLYWYLVKCNQFTVVNGSEDIATIQNKIINTVKNYLEG